MLAKFFSALAIFLVVVGIGWAGYIYYRDRRPPNQGDIAWVQNQVTALFSKNISQPQLPEAGNQLVSTVSQTAQSAAERASQTLGASIEVSTNAAKPIAEKALDRARYEYCKQVVMEYEKTSE